MTNLELAVSGDIAADLPSLASSTNSTIALLGRAYEIEEALRYLEEQTFQQQPAIHETGVAMRQLEERMERMDERVQPAIDETRSAVDETCSAVQHLESSLQMVTLALAIVGITLVIGTVVGPLNLSRSSTSSATAASSTCCDPTHDKTLLSTHQKNS